MTDFTVIPKYIDEAIKRNTQELTEEQFLLMRGVLVKIQSKIENLGLQNAIDVLATTVKRDLTK